ncbi:MAG: hypothetical protein IT529_08350 [Burkholderiales bacterium]|nr:hypothetical protein [Burkholderiales bacterium]
MDDASKRLPLTALRVEDWPGTWNRPAIIYRTHAYLSPLSRRLIARVKKTAHAQERDKRPDPGCIARG